MVQRLRFENWNFEESWDIKLLKSPCIKVSLKEFMDWALSSKITERKKEDSLYPKNSPCGGSETVLLFGELRKFKNQKVSINNRKFRYYFKFVFENGLF